MPTKPIIPDHEVIEDLLAAMEDQDHGALDTLLEQYTEYVAADTKAGDTTSSIALGHTIFLNAATMAKEYANLMQECHELDGAEYEEAYGCALQAESRVWDLCEELGYSV